MLIAGSRKEAQAIVDGGLGAGLTDHCAVIVELGLNHSFLPTKPQYPSPRPIKPAVNIGWFPEYRFHLGLFHPVVDLHVVPPRKPLLVQDELIREVKTRRSDEENGSPKPECLV